MPKNLEKRPKRYEELIFRGLFLLEQESWYFDAGNVSDFCHKRLQGCIKTVR